MLVLELGLEMDASVPHEPGAASRHSCPKNPKKPLEVQELGGALEQSLW